MTPRPQENTTVVHASDEMEAENHSKKSGYVNNAFVTTELGSSSGPMAMMPIKFDLSGDLKQNPSLSSIKPVVDFDDLLPHIGEFGRYQKILFLLMIPFAFFVAFVYFSQIFITLVPDEHFCNVPELVNLTVEQR